MLYQIENTSGMRRAVRVAAKDGEIELRHVPRSSSRGGSPESDSRGRMPFGGSIELLFAVEASE